jgi:TetR/AcrR family transcriptional regulator, transcriptional repressor for nem operon
MGREKQFDPAEVLHTAADLFSAHGYQGTSLAMIQQATGLGKQSLYNSFGDKRGLYLQALDCAVARWSSVSAGMAACASGRQAVQLFFVELQRQCASADTAEQACIVSAGLLEDVDDAEVQARLRDKWRSSHELLRSTIERGQKDGSVTSPLPSAALADVLMSLMSGLRVSSRVAWSPERVAQVVALGLLLLDLSPQGQRPP